MAQLKNIKKKPHKKSNVIKIGAIAIPILLIIVIAFIIKNQNTSSAGGATGDVAMVAVTKDSDLLINISDISETATFYPIEIDGTKMEVLAVKAPDGTIRTAFNTCQVCYGSGRGYYVQDGDQLVCQNCGNRFGMGDVEVTKGGCNPVPITPKNKTVDATSITISKDYLAQTKVIFENWK